MEFLIDSYNYFFIACRNGNLQKVKLLVNLYGKDIITSFDSQALKVACEHGHFEIVKFLVENGSDIHSGKTFCFRIAASCGHLEIVKFLIEKGVDIHADFDYAIRRSKKIEMVKFLLEHGADINANESESLETAVGDGRFDLVKFLYAHGAGINQRAFANACESGQIDIVKFLYKHGTDITISRNLARACRNGHLEVVKFLVLEHGADIQAENNIALRTASESRFYHIVKFLIEHGADVTAKEHFVLRTAIKYCDIQILDFLIDIPLDISNCKEKFFSDIFLRRKKIRIHAVNTIAKWWIPKCYDMKRDCGKRMAENGWNFYNSFEF